MAWWYEFSSIHARRCHGIRGRMNARDIAYHAIGNETDKYFDTCAEALAYADKFFKAHPEALAEVRTEIVERTPLGDYVCNFRYFAVYHRTDGACGDRVTKAWAQPVTDEMIRDFEQQK